jgi:hypothetical protein
MWIPPKISVRHGISMDIISFGPAPGLHLSIPFLPEDRSCLGRLDAATHIAIPNWPCKRSNQIAYPTPRKLQTFQN